MTTLTLVCADSTLELNREQALQLELKLNLTKSHHPEYSKIGDDLYSFQSSYSQDNKTRVVTPEQYGYLMKLEKIQYEEVVKDPELYSSL